MLSVVNWTMTACNTSTIYYELNYPLLSEFVSEKKENKQLSVALEPSWIKT